MAGRLLELEEELLELDDELEEELLEELLEELEPMGFGAPQATSEPAQIRATALMILFIINPGFG